VHLDDVEPGADRREGTGDVAAVGEARPSRMNRVMKTSENPVSLLSATVRERSNGRSAKTSTAVLE
jgi:hypothetical protein